MPMSESTMKDMWAEVDRYFGDLLTAPDGYLADALRANREAGLPAIEVSRLQGKFLHVLVQITQARRILEIGLLGGYSTIWMASALPQDGRIVSLEYEPRHAEVARKNLANAGLLDRVEIRIGPALDSLPALASSAPFDLIFIDADKPSNPQYLQWALKLSRPGTVIVVDNVVRQGKIADAASTDPDIRGTRQMFDLMASEPRLSSVAMQNVGVKGYDGFALAVVRP